MNRSLKGLNFSSVPHTDCQTLLTDNAFVPDYCETEELSVTAADLSCSWKTKMAGYGFDLFLDAQS
jgi:hypothetical protein